MRNSIIQMILIVLLFIYLFYGFDARKIDFSKFSLFGVLATFIMMILSQVVLSIRWMKMSSLSFKISFETIIISSALNMLLPAKLGELSKAFYLKKFYQYNYHKTLSIIFVERFFDIIMLFMLLCIWAYKYSASEMVKSFLGILGIAIFVIVFLFNSSKFLSLLKKIPLQFLRIYLQKIYKTVHQMFCFSFSLLFYSALLWIMYFLVTYTFFTYGVTFNLNITAILGLFIFSTLALALPLAPAGIGTYEATIVFYLGSYGVNKEDALVAATLYHILSFALDFLLLYLLLFFKDIKFGELVKQ